MLKQRVLKRLLWFIREWTQQRGKERRELGNKARWMSFNGCPDVGWAKHIRTESKQRSSCSALGGCGADGSPAVLPPSRASGKSDEATLPISVCRSWEAVRQRGQWEAWPTVTWDKGLTRFLRHEWMGGFESFGPTPSWRPAATDTRVSNLVRRRGNSGTLLGLLTRESCGLRAAFPRKIKWACSQRCRRRYQLCHQTRNVRPKGYQTGIEKYLKKWLLKFSWFDTKPLMYTFKTLHEF